MLTCDPRSSQVAHQEISYGSGWTLNLFAKDENFTKNCPSAWNFSKLIFFGKIEHLKETSGHQPSLSVALSTFKNIQVFPVIKKKNIRLGFSHMWKWKGDPKNLQSTVFVYFSYEINNFKVNEFLKSANLSKNLNVWRTDPSSVLMQGLGVAENKIQLWCMNKF